MDYWCPIVLTNFSLKVLRKLCYAHPGGFPQRNRP